jgi:hypothetical protein
MFSRSTNGGQFWSTPVRINDDPVGGNAWQWFGTMSVAPNGRIDAIWNDSRGDPGGYDSAVYYSFSTDGGLTWSPNEAATPSFNPLVGWPQQNKIGDYYHMISDEGGASLAYSATFNGEQDVYFLRLGDPICPDAGTIRLDRPNYMCSGTAGLVVLDCGLNTDDSTIQTVSVAVDSTLETGVEQALLTETSAGSARFEGSIALSTSDAPGVLLVAEGNVITATYQDADDGTGTPATVQATALVDCTPPGISNVHTTNIEPRAAVVAFDATEPSQGIVHYGTSCANLSGVAVGSGYASSPTVSVGGLTDNTTYFYSVEAEDEAGNTALDDNGGSCYTFSTPEVPDFFTELFDSAANDLDNISLMFTPNGSNDFYAACAEPITALPTDPTGGTTLSMTDDSFATITIGGGQSVKLYGTSYTTIYPASNGYISLAAGESGYTESFATHFAAPRVAALFDDLNPASGGTVSWRQLSDRVAVTWLNVFEYGATSPNTFQIVMYFDGRLEINYLSVAVADGLAGLSAGGGVDPDFLESDLSALGACGPRPPTATNRAASTAVSVPVTVTLQATDDDLPDPPAALTYVVSSLPAHGSLSDPQAGSIDSVPYTLANRGDQVMYEPNSGYQGQDTFQYVANDGGTPPEGGDSNIGLVTITVGGAAWNPVAHNVSFGTAVSQAVNVVLNGTDPNSDPLTYVIETLPAAGYLQDPNGGEITVVPYTLLAGGHVVVYQPPCGEVISASFTYTVHDATAGSNVATAAVTVNSSGPRLVYNFPLDSNPGWTLDAAWAFGQPLGLGSHNHDPNAGHTGSTVYGYNLSGDYANNLPARYLTTTALNCSNMTATELRFWRWLAVERYDRARVEASNDGSNWVVLWENPTTTTLSETSWTQQIIDLSAVADGRSTVWVRWSMGPTDTSTTYPGWNLDDIEFWGIVPAVSSDFNGDGLVNATDLGLLVDCLQGPSEQAAFECLCKDLDADGDVDLADFAQFQAAFGG